MERVLLCVVFLLLISRGAPEKKGVELSTAFMGSTEPPATVSEGTEGRGRPDPNFSGSTVEVGLNQTESPTDGELQPNTTHLPLPEKDRINYLWYYVALCCFFAFACSFSLPCCPMLPSEEISCSLSDEAEQSSSECDSIASMDAVIDLPLPETSEDLRQSP